MHASSGPSNSPALSSPAVPRPALTQITAQLWRVPRYALKTAGAAAAPLLQPLGQALPHWFAASSHSAVLYMVAEMVKVFGRDPAHHPVIGQPLPA